jgi:hypothetical protein
MKEGNEVTHTIRESFIKEAHAAACEDWKKRIEAEFPGMFVIHRLGDRYKIGDSEYILACVNYKSIALINLESGNRYTDPIECAYEHNNVPNSAVQLASNNDDFIKVLPHPLK